MNTQLSSTRIFKIWEYQVSHGQLLIRSPKAPASSSSPEQRTNFDIAFNGVEYMALPRLLRGLEFMTATVQELDLLCTILDRSIDSENVFILRSGEHRFPVVAASSAISENDWDIFESPFEFRSQFHTGADLGQK